MFFASGSISRELRSAFFSSHPCTGVQWNFLRCCQICCQFTIGCSVRLIRYRIALEKFILRGAEKFTKSLQSGEFRFPADRRQVAFLSRRPRRDAMRVFVGRGQLQYRTLDARGFGCAGSLATPTLLFLDPQGAEAGSKELPEKALASLSSQSWTMPANKSSRGAPRRC